LALTVVGCAHTETAEQRQQRAFDEQQMVERAKAADMAALKESIKETCAYAIDDKYKYGDCVRQEVSAYRLRQQNYEMQMQSQAQARAFADAQAEDKKRATQAQMLKILGGMAQKPLIPVPPPVPQTQFNCISQATAPNQFTTNCQ